MGKTKIEWTDFSWNPLSGCTPISPGCTRCYARALIQRYKGRKGWPNSPDEVTFFPNRIHVPYQWREHKSIFVCSMSDLFHADVTEEQIDAILKTIEDLGRHTFMVLTKRDERLCSYGSIGKLNLHNLWLGVTTENQKYVDQRIPNLLAFEHYAPRFISAEPLLGEIDITAYPGLKWVVCGAETGAMARPMNPDWARSLRDQCLEIGIPFFLKKLSDGSRELDGQLWEKYPGE